jgi:type II secretory pathway component PulJ
MTQNYPRQRNPEVAIGILLLALGGIIAFVWFIAVSRLHMRNPQCLELFLYMVLGLLGAGLVLSHYIRRRQKREENWPHPALAISSRLDDRHLKAARDAEATLLGYNQARYGTAHILVPAKRHHDEMHHQKTAIP